MFIELTGVPLRERDINALMKVRQGSQLFPVFYFYSLSKLRSAFAGKEISNPLNVRLTI